MLRIRDNYDFKKWVLITERCDGWFGKAYACIDANGMRCSIRKSMMKSGVIKVYDRFSSVPEDAEVQGEEDND